MQQSAVKACILVTIFISGEVTEIINFLQSHPKFVEKYDKERGIETEENHFIKYFLEIVNNSIVLELVERIYKQQNVIGSGLMGFCFASLSTKKLRNITNVLWAFTFTKAIKWKPLSAVRSGPWGHGFHGKVDYQPN